MADKTEAPTPRRLSEAREEGNIVRSQELVTAAILLVSVVLLQGPGASLINVFKEMLLDAIASLPIAKLTVESLRDLAINEVMRIAPSMVLFIFALLMTGVMATGLQTGFLWAGKRLEFKGDRFNPLSGFKRIFSKQGLTMLAKGILKLVVVGWVAYAYIRSNISGLLTLGQAEFISGMSAWTGLALGLILRVASVYFVLAVGDYAFERWRYIRTMRMTKEEVKEEFKRSEGDPLLKSRIRGEMRRMARMRMLSNVQKASVVVTNPTHLAVALEYHDDMRAPVVVAKGAHLIAGRIVELAREASIPVVQNIPLARTLYRTVEVDQEIPPDLYLTVAEVMAYVYRLQHQAAYIPVTTS
ncbi:MAG TPA: flagellar biosynthesis protein FlhB [Anaerolineaceae bacterium]